MSICEVRRKHHAKHTKILQKKTNYLNAKKNLCREHAKEGVTKQHANQKPMQSQKCPIYGYSGQGSRTVWPSNIRD